MVAFGRDVVDELQTTLSDRLLSLLRTAITHLKLVDDDRLVELVVDVELSVHPGGKSPGIMHGTPELVDVGSAVVLRNDESVSRAASLPAQ